MIVQASTELRQLLVRYNELKQNESQLDSIQKTENELVLLKRDLNGWVVIFPVLEPYVSDHIVNELNQQVVSIQRKLGECKVRFVNVHRYPQEQLKLLSRLVSQLRADTERAWSQYASNWLAPVNDAVRSGRQLPALQSKVTQIDPILSNLHEQSQRLPKQAKDVHQFHENLELVRKILQDVPSMSPAQKVFMSRVEQGTATLADLDDSLLQWCKQQGLAPQLKISKRI